MNKYLAAAAAVTMTLVAAPAFAQSLDGSIGYTSYDVEGLDLGSVTGRLSYGINDVIGIEGEAAFGIDDTSVRDEFGDVYGVELKHSFGVYGTAGIPLGENGRLFARAGYVTSELEATIASVTESGSEAGFAYGVGAQFMISGPNGIRVDYTRFDVDDIDVDSWSISYVRRFR